MATIKGARKAASTPMPQPFFMAGRYSGRSSQEPRRANWRDVWTLVESVTVQGQSVEIYRHSTGLGMLLVQDDLCHLAGDVASAREWRDLRAVNWAGADWRMLVTVHE